MRGRDLEQRIRRAMGAADVRGMAELARRSGIQRDTLYAWFRGDQEPRPDTLARVAEVLGLQLGDLWQYAPEEPADPLLVALNRQTAILERTYAQLADNAAAQEQGLSDLAQAIADVLRIVEARLGGAEDGDAAPVASSRRDRS